MAVALNRPATGPQYHMVKTGDTLSRIADQYYNSIHQWARIYEANKDTVKILITSISG